MNRCINGVGTAFMNKIRRRKCLCLITMMFLLMGIFLLTHHLYLLRDFIYIIRPTFDQKVTFKHVITHYYHGNVLDENNNHSIMNAICALHGWKHRQGPEHFKIIDAFLFSLEFDILELRLRELWPVVDRFVVMESGRTFSGQKKPLWLSQNVTRFSWAMKKLSVFNCNGLRELRPGENPFKNEIAMRNCMSREIKRIARYGDLVIVGDVDEIPRRSTISLFRQCTGFPPVVHLQMKTYFYSFEYYFSSDDFWQAKIQFYDPMTFYYSHQKRSDHLLADSGWHCTFFFRYLSDFRFKMTSYSHNDRLMGRNYLLTDRELQHRICNGLDVFDMYPEVYSFKELIMKFGSIPSTDSFVDVPRALLERPEKFRYLLKGNCLREDFKE